MTFMTTTDLSYQGPEHPWDLDGHKLVLDKSVPAERAKAEVPETDLAFNAFVEYRNMRVKRSLRNLAKQQDRDISTIERWSSKYAWKKRSIAYDTHLSDEYVTADLFLVREMKSIHAEGARFLFDKAMKHLKKMDMTAAKMADIIKMLELAAKLESRSRDEADNKIEVGGEMAITSLAELSKEVLALQSIDEDDDMAYLNEDEVDTDDEDNS